MQAASYRATESNPRYQAAVRAQQQRERERRAAEEARKAREKDPVAFEAERARQVEEAKNAAIRAAVEKYAPDNADRPETVHEIMKRMARTWGVTLADLKGPSRKKRIAWVRAITMQEIKELRPTISLPEIGRHFGNRDHTTVLHALRRGSYKTKLKRVEINLELASRMRRAGATHEKIAKHFDCARSTLRRHLVAYEAR